MTPTSPCSSRFAQTSRADGVTQLLCRPAHAAIAHYLETVGQPPVPERAVPLPSAHRERAAAASRASMHESKHDELFRRAASDLHCQTVDNVAVAAGSVASGGAAPAVPCNLGTTPPDTYLQTFGAWPSGSASIDNIPFEQIPIANGVWNLIAYDWFVLADSGSFTDWELCFDVGGGSNPTTFCPAQTPGSSSGCLPTIAATGNPNVGQNNNCVITVSNVEGQKSRIIFYGVAGTTVNVWCLGGNSFLCVKAPTQRTLGQNSGGTTGQCDGSLTLDWNAFQNANPISLGNPFSAGQHAYVQGWFRDPPSCRTTFLSEGLDMTYVP